MQWQYATAKEVAGLIHQKCFDFKSPNFKASKEYQYCRLHMMYDIKTDLAYKARLTYDGSRVYPRGLSTCATVVKGVSVRLLDIIIDSYNLEAMTEDIDNTFIQDHTKEKIYTKCGPKFGDRA